VIDAPHEHAPYRHGPAIPRRYGSWRSEVCRCGAWRTTTWPTQRLDGATSPPEHVSDWRTDDIVDAATEDGET